MFTNFKIKVKQLKAQIKTLYLVYLHKDVAWYKKAFLLLIIAYAASPIDLIPDFIPVLGLLDDFILIPLGIIIAIKIIPNSIWVECEEKVKDGITIDKKYKIFGIMLISILWLAIVLSVLTKIIR